MSGNPVQLGPVIITTLPPTYSPNGHPGGGFLGGVGGAIGFGQVIQWMRESNERYYQSNVSTSSRHYESPEENSYIVKAIVNFSLPGLVAISGHFGDAFKLP